MIIQRNNFVTRMRIIYITFNDSRLWIFCSTIFGIYQYLFSWTYKYVVNFKLEGSLYNTHGIFTRDREIWIYQRPTSCKAYLEYDDMLQLQNVDVILLHVSCPHSWRLHFPFFIIQCFLLIHRRIGFTTNDCMYTFHLKLFVPRIHLLFLFTSSI